MRWQAMQNESQARTMNIADNNMKKANVGLGGAGGYTAPLQPYQNELGTYVPATDTQYDKAGNIIPKKANGGTVYKMKKVPKLPKKNS